MIEQRTLCDVCKQVVGDDEGVRVEVAARRVRGTHVRDHEIPFFHEGMHLHEDCAAEAVSGFYAGIEHARSRVFSGGQSLDWRKLLMGPE